MNDTRAGDRKGLSRRRLLGAAGGAAAVGALGPYSGLAGGAGPELAGGRHDGKTREWRVALNTIQWIAYSRGLDRSDAAAAAHGAAAAGQASRVRRRASRYSGGHVDAGVLAPASPELPGSVLGIPVAPAARGRGLGGDDARERPTSCAAARRTGSADDLPGDVADQDGAACCAAGAWRSVRPGSPGPCDRSGPAGVARPRRGRSPAGAAPARWRLDRDGVRVALRARQRRATAARLRARRRPHDVGRNRSGENHSPIPRPRCRSAHQGRARRHRRRQPNGHLVIPRDRGHGASGSSPDGATSISTPSSTRSPGTSADGSSSRTTGPTSPSGRARSTPPPGCG